MADSLDKVLNSLPRTPLEGLDLNAIQNDRKKYWDNFMKKYEELSNKCTEEVPVSKLGTNSVQQNNLKIGACSVPVTKAVRSYLRKQGDMLDELTTIAGPPQKDEEDLSSDSDLDDNDDNDAESDQKEEDKNSTDDASKEGYVGNVTKSDNQNGENKNSTNDVSKESYVFESDLSWEMPQKKANKLDSSSSNSNDESSDEGLCYTPDKSNAVRRFSPRHTSSAFVDPAAKPRIKQDLKLQANRMTPLKQSFVNRLKAATLYECVLCGEKGDLNIEEEKEYKCDTCLMEKTHPECDDEACMVCREVAATLEARWYIRGEVNSITAVDSFIATNSERDNSNTTGACDYESTETDDSKVTEKDDSSVRQSSFLSIMNVSSCLETTANTNDSSYVPDSDGSD